MTLRDNRLSVQHFYREIPEYKAAPWYLGFAWWRPDTRTAMCALIPFNWLFRWARDVYLFLRRGPRDGGYTKGYTRGFSQGYSQGYSQGRDDMQKTMDAAITVMRER